MESVIRAAIKDALTKLGITELDFVVEHPADMAHGDYATNVALTAAAALGRPPREVAEELAAALNGQIETVEKIEVAGPGFINFHLAREFFTLELSRARELGEDWGRHDTWAGKTVIVEYTSPNLFKPLHIGNLVGNIIGESFTRLFEFAGADVKRFNYPSDIGLTVAKGVWGLRKTGGDPGDINAIGEAYRVGNEYYEKGGEEAEDIKEINKALYQNSDPELSALRAAGIETSKQRLQELLDELDTQFDHEITESQASPLGADIVRAHEGTVFAKSDGAVVYQGERVGLHTRVFLNSAGLPTYEAKDVGHFKLKHESEPNWDVSIIVTGGEQQEYFKVVFAALKELFPELADRTLTHIPTGFLTLTTGKMSSRKGNVLTGESLLEEMRAAARERADREVKEETVSAIAVAALKYQILRHGVGSNIVFDKERALSFEGDSGPYLQYTHARITSVLEKAAAAGVKPAVTNAPPVPYAVEQVLYRWPEVVAAALAERAPHHVTGYLTELASAFNSFYATEKIADPADPHAPYKAALADVVRQTLASGLWVLGIKAPERM
jgi:arginyl-tRNA synthetase